MNRILRIFTLAGLVWGTEIQAETKAPDLPVPPMDRITCKVTFTSVSAPQQNPDPTIQPDPAIPKPKTPKEIQITRFDTVQRNRIQWSDDSVTEDWISGNYLLSKSPIGGWINTIDMTQYSLANEWVFYTRKSLFFWVSPATYIGESPRDSRTTYLYQRKDLGPDAMEQVWQDVKSGFPIAYQCGPNACTFSFGKAPASAPQLPPEFSQELERYIRLATPPTRISNER